MIALNVDHISFSYHQPSQDAFGLYDITFAVEKGEFFSILGPNGSGKTTLLRIIDRILLPSSGTVRIFDKDYRTLTRKEIARRIGVVPQEHPIIFPYTVREVVTMGRTPHLRGLGFENTHDQQIVNEAMELTDIVHFAEKPITQLSGGERQRVFIARALAQEPDILLLDEPNAHLDITHQLDILHLTRSLSSQRGLTVVAVFHDLNLAALFSNRILLLAKGAAAALGTPRDVLTQNHLSTVFRTKVTVDQHPFASVPRVTIIPSFDAPLHTHTLRQEKS
jgi:iron complex transport system ATP-binding protein